MVVHGIPASNGIAYGQIFLYLQKDLDLPSYHVDSEKRIAEIARFEQALLTTRQQIMKVQAEVEKNLGEDEARIFDAHLLVLEDQALISETIREFETSNLNIETCFHKVSQRYIEAFDRIDDEYLRERATDIRDVTKRVLENLLGQPESNLSTLADKRIVVALDINPSDSASIDRSRALAVVTDGGSRTSHAVIVARSMKVPAVVGLRELTRKVQNGDWAIVDGYDGVVIVNPSEQTLFRYGKIQSQKKTLETRVLAASQLPAETKDGHRVTLLANIEKVDETALVLDYGADGVGLFRSEYLFLNSSHIPSEEEQYEAYRAVAEGLAPRPVIIRTLDLGGDKPIATGAILIQHEANPFLGFRAIRFCLENLSLFKDQLRAILRASVHGNVKLMYPMISGAEELCRANAVLEQAKGELIERGQKFDPEMEVGSMIEIPSAAATADILAEKCDFFSVGTNDLIQYLLAIDRVNDRIAHLYEPTHPGVLRTLKSIFDQARAHGIRAGVCGEMAGDPVYVPLLLGLGADELSLTPPLVPAVKYLIRNMKLSEAKKLAREALTLSDPKEIFARAEAFYKEHVSELMGE